MQNENEMDPRLAQKLAALSGAPQRDPENIRLGRAAFLAEAERLAASVLDPDSAAVSSSRKPRRIEWMHAFRTAFQTPYKERSPMFQMISTILLILSIALGGSSVTMAAAQTSLPDDPLYPLKTWSEELRAGWNRDPQAQIRFSLDLAKRRAEEVRRMLQAGTVPSEATQNRLQAELEKALALTAEQPEPQAVQALNRIREQVHLQEQAFLALGSLPQEQADAALQRTRAVLEETLRRCDAGLADPSRLREHLRDRDQDRDPVQEQDQDRDREQKQDREPAQEKEPVQDRDQDRDRIQDPLEDREQEREREQNREREHKLVTPTTPEATPAPSGGHGPGPGDGSGGTGVCEGCTPEPQHTGNPDPGPKPENHGDDSNGNDSGQGGSPDDGNHHGEDGGGGAGEGSGKGGNR